jgi:integration host factor subunit alpha
MTKADLANSIIEKIGLSSRESAEIVDQVFELMKNTLQKGEQVKISGFGTFNVRQKKERRGRNPQTGEAIELPGRRVLKFKVSHVLNRMMNGAE